MRDYRRESDEGGRSVLGQVHHNKVRHQINPPKYVMGMSALRIQSSRVITNHTRNVETETTQHRRISKERGDVMEVSKLQRFENFYIHK